MSDWLEIECVYVFPESCDEPTEAEESANEFRGLATEMIKEQNGGDLPRDSYAALERLKLISVPRTVGGPSDEDVSHEDFFSPTIWRWAYYRKYQLDERDILLMIRRRPHPPMAFLQDLDHEDPAETDYEVNQFREWFERVGQIQQAET